MKFLKRVTILAVVYIMVYLAGALLLRYTDMSYRAWGRAAKTILLAAEVFLYVCWSYFGYGLLVLFSDTEKAITFHLLATNYGADIGTPYYVCERPFLLFFKVPGTVTTKDKTDYLEEKYGREFDIGGVDGEVIYDTEFPEVRTYVYFSADSGIFRDDYVKGVLAYYLAEGMKELDIDREYYISKDVRRYNGDFHIQLKDENDIPMLAEDVSRLIDYVCERTTLFEKNRGYLYFYCGDIDIRIPFGEPDRQNKLAADELAGQEKLEEFIGERYKAAAEEYIDPVETNAKILYDAVFANQGYSYEVCYNAKGNLYINLGSRPAGEAGDRYNTGTYGFTLVYDRTSKNGACELFVLYKEHYPEDGGMGQSDATAILDMYAVEVATGKVAVADKQSWSDVGDREYRELTGE